MARRQLKLHGLVASAAAAQQLHPQRDVGGKHVRVAVAPKVDVAQRQAPARRFGCQHPVTHDQLRHGRPPAASNVGTCMRREAARAGVLAGATHTARPRWRRRRRRGGNCLRRKLLLALCSAHNRGGCVEQNRVQHTCPPPQQPALSSRAHPPQASVLIRLQKHVRVGVIVQPDEPAGLHCGPDGLYWS